MRRVVIILPGIASEPAASLDNSTPLTAAATPALAALAQAGKVGQVVIDPPGAHEHGSGAAAAMNTILGGAWVEPEAPEKPSLLRKLVAPPKQPRMLPDPTDGQALAHAAGIPLDESDIAWRIDLIAATADADAPIVQSHQPESLTREEASSLLDAWAAALRSSDDSALHAFECRALSTPNDCPDPASIHLLIHRNAAAHADATVCVHAEMLNGKPWHAYPPEGPGADTLIQAMELSQRVFEAHPVNRTRAEIGLAPVSVAWISGHDARGAARTHSPLSERTGLGAVLATTDQIAAAVGVMHGLPVLPLPTLTNTIFAADRLKMLANAVIDALDHHELVIVHDAVALRSALAGDVHGVIESIESIDAKLITPIRDALLLRGEVDEEPAYRMLVLTDRRVDVDSRAFTAGAAPFVVAGAYVRSMVERTFSEADAADSDLQISEGPSLLEYALHSGVSRARSHVRAVSTHKTQQAD